MDFKDRLVEQLEKAVEVILRKNAEYGGSWVKRGGVGAFMMFARKWDRLEHALEIKNSEGRVIGYRDFFELALTDRRQEGIIDDLEDLRNYLILSLDEIRVRQAAYDQSKEPVQCSSLPREERTSQEAKA